MTRPANRLIDATSPYLLQHAHNPVDWYPWGQEAFDAARRRDVPVFLSVGYAACHWCHVMERESFEDPATASLLNERFVSVKVDREERPDIDAIYMDAVQAMNRGQGGWPMSVFMSPEGAPFYGGTYFPDVARHGMPSFTQVLEAIDGAWRERRDDVLRSGAAVVQTLRDVTELRAADAPLTGSITTDAAALLRKAFDPVWGGFGGAPKFPQPMTLEFLLRVGIRGDQGALDMVMTTLDHMSAGGMYDQVAGGFARYSVDERWHVPHFEKMLSDNALLVQLFTRAWQVTRDPAFSRVVYGTCGYLLREMQQAQGGFSASQDADSEGAEGRFATWTWDELVDAIGEEAAGWFGATPAGNWHGEDGATNVIRRPEGGWTDRAEAARLQLAGIRASRVPPGVDDKVVAAWNGLAIRALCEASRVFGEPGWLDAARRAATFAWTHLQDDGGRVRRSWRSGATSGPGFADDHAGLAAAYQTLFETTGETEWFERAGALCEILLTRFHDPERGGFFTTAHDAEALVVRPKDLYDNAVPSGNSAAAEVLQRMSLLTGDPRFERAAVGALSLVADAMRRAPAGFGHALCALDLYLGPSVEIAIVGDRADPIREAMMAEVTAHRYLPNAVIAVGEGAHTDPVVPLLAGRSRVEGRPAAYVCTRFICERPVTTVDELAALLT